MLLPSWKQTSFVCVGPTTPPPVLCLFGQLLVRYPNKQNVGERNSPKCQEELHFEPLWVRTTDSEIVLYNETTLVKLS